MDLLLVDSGDLHDGKATNDYHRLLLPSDSFFLGTGLSDGFPPGGVDAHDVLLDFCRLNVLC